jgi:uncharacterized protein (UPF0332 family)
VNDDRISGYMTQAGRSLDAAEVLLQAGYPDFAVSRLYYSSFYVARAMLLERGMEFSRHRATIGQFGIVFARSAQSPFRPFHRLLHRPLESRHTLVAQGREFLAAAQYYLGAGS